MLHTHNDAHGARDRAGARCARKTIPEYATTTLQANVQMHLQVAARMARYGSQRAPPYALHVGATNDLFRCTAMYAHGNGAAFCALPENVSRLLLQAFQPTQQLRELAIDSLGHTQRASLVCWFK